MEIVTVRTAKKQSQSARNTLPDRFDIYRSVVSSEESAV